MKTLGNLAAAVLSVCIAAGAVIRISPDGSIKKYLKYLVSLCVLAAVLSPLIDGVGTMLSFDGNISVGEGDSMGAPHGGEYIIDAEKAEIEEAICSLIASKWRLEKEKICVSLTLDKSNISAIEIRKIDIKIKGVAKTEEIRRYIDEMFYGTAGVTVSEVE